MKKIIIILGMALVFCTGIAAEEAEYAPTIVEEWNEQQNVAEIFFMSPGSSAGLRYEMKIDDTISAGVSALYCFVGPAHSYGLRAEAYFYPQSHALNAWFVGPFAGVYNMNTEFSGPVFFSLGAQAGYRWIFGFITVTPRVLLQYGLGYDAGKKIWAGAGGFNNSSGVSVGYAF